MGLSQKLLLAIAVLLVLETAFWMVLIYLGVLIVDCFVGSLIVKGNTLIDGDILASDLIVTVESDAMECSDGD